MGITLHLKQVSVSTLEILQQNPNQIDLFYIAKFYTEDIVSNERKSDFFKISAVKLSLWTSLESLKQRIIHFIFPSVEEILADSRERLHQSAYKEQFLAEWETPDLDLHKYFPELSYLLAGYSDYGCSIPELKPHIAGTPRKFSLQFLTIDNSEWDGLPLVNLIWHGTQIGREGTNWYQTPDEVSRLLEGLRSISVEGFQSRYRREAASENPCPLFDWSDEDLIESLTEYYNEIVSYYQDASQRGNAMMADLSI